MAAGSTGGVIFDLDGTLLDTNYFHTLAWWRALRGAGLDVPMARIHRGIGMAGDTMLAKLVGEHRPDIDAAHAVEFQRYLQDLRPLPGAHDLLAAVRDLGLAVVVGTSARPENVSPMLEVLGGRAMVDIVVDSGDVETGKPAPDIFSVALERAGLDLRRALAVGDTAWDIEAAHGAGIGCVAVLTGGWSSDELEAAGAVRVYETAADLLSRLDSSPIAALAR